MAFNDFTYGLFGGLSGTLISHPFDTIKTRIQTNKASTIGQAVKIGKLYSGITPPLVGIMLEKSIVFGFISTIVVTPVDRLKINYQNQELKMNNLETIKKVLAPKNLYKGFTPTIFRETPGFGIYFSTYNYLTDRFNKFNNIGTTFCFGALSGLSAWLFIYPSDLIKTKYQAVNNKTSLPNTIKNIWILNNPNNNIFRGMRNFYSGFNLAILRAMPLHGGVFLGYELSKKILVN
jgi:solute carrier family 25 carnitine/acylcarnitine transporter 20/29